MANREPPVISAYQTRRILLALVGAVILFGIAGLFTFRFLKRRAVWLQTWLLTETAKGQLAQSQRRRPLRRSLTSPKPRSPVVTSTRIAGRNSSWSCTTTILS